MVSMIICISFSNKFCIFLRQQCYSFSILRRCSFIITNIVIIIITLLLIMIIFSVPFSLLHSTVYQLQYFYHRQFLVIRQFYALIQAQNLLKLLNMKEKAPRAAVCSNCGLYWSLLEAYITLPATLAIIIRGGGSWAGVSRGAGTGFGQIWSAVIQYLQHRVPIL